MTTEHEKTPQSSQDATAAWLAAFSREGVPVGTPSPPLPRAPIALYDELDASDAKRSTGAAGDPLGIYTKNPSLFSPEKRPSLIGKVLARRGDIELPDKKDQAANRLERWALQSVARHALPDSRTAACMRNRAKGCPDVAVKWSKAAERASYANLQVCGSVWACPVCAAKISEHRRKELLDLVEKHQAAGGFVYLITRTFSHKSTSSLAALQGGLKVAEGKLKSGKYWQSMKADFGYVGTVRALEVTLASASGGWHPHIHELWFVASKLTTQQQEELRGRMFDKWAKACAAAGLGAPSEEHGVDVRGGKDAARYISKWGMASELTKGHVKQSAKGLSPFDLLRLGLHTKDTGAAKLARDLFAEYAEAMKGRQQLVWSQGLRQKYAIEEADDAEVVEGTEPDAEVLGRMDMDQWRAIVRTERRGQLLEAINKADGKWSAAVAVIAQAVAQHQRGVGAVRPDGSEAEATAVAQAQDYDAWPDTGTPAKPIARHAKQEFFMTEDQQAIVAQRLADEFGMSIDGAQGLAGAALDAWIEQAEDACMWVVQTWTPEANQRRPGGWSPIGLKRPVGAF